MKSWKACDKVSRAAPCPDRYTDRVGELVSGNTLANMFRVQHVVSYSAASVRRARRLADAGGRRYASCFIAFCGAGASTGCGMLSYGQVPDSVDVPTFVKSEADPAALGMCRPGFGPIWGDFDQVGPTSTERGPDLSKHIPRSAKVGVEFDGPAIAKIGHVGEMRFRQIWGELDRSSMPCGVLGGLLSGRSLPGAPHSEPTRAKACAHSRRRLSCG